MKKDALTHHHIFHHLKYHGLSLCELADVGSQISKAHGIKLTKAALLGLRQLRAVIFLARYF